MEVPGGGSIVTRSVWASNLETEFELMRSVITSYPLISMDTEFPGVIFHSNSDVRQPEHNYAVMKSNVECLHLIQVGLTLSDCHGNLPSFQSSDRFIWEFNFREFNVACDPHASDSIELLQRQGIDLEKNRKFGVDIIRFVELLMFSGMICNSNIQWITFHGAYDFGYLVKALTYRFLPTQPLLPVELSDFMQLVKFFFGGTIYDVKHMIKFCPNLYGGLDRVCESLCLDRAVGKSHQAGSDSLLTLHAFNKIKNVYFSENSCSDVFNYKDVLYGLELF
ncbi:probable CCR4-associated factor 1 homolog 11 [Vigna radiata var. radiata]|uniref:poly(A)-specific ribonuclease n=1 Tax=Vigna radiata var. radiata TaxID=3916 RepID=A0A3Q0ENE0_VIGRR|nr:probable CCR4-associated factor 1 homolog 11 [Vigna radiata var. radiata]